MVSLRGIWPDGNVPSTGPQEFPDIAFVRVLRDAGLQVDAVIADGNIHRVCGEDDRSGRKSGWYVYYSEDIPAGAYGDWRSGLTESWCSRAVDTLSNAERIAHQARLEKARREREAEEARLHEETALAAQAYLAACKKAPDTHPYLARKRVRANPGVLVDGMSNLVLPMRDVTGKLWTYETISPGGNKLFCKHGRKKGNFFTIGELGAVIRLVEGYATGATVHEATGDGVVVCMDSGNLVAVAPAIRERYPQARLIVCADNDTKPDGSNPGVEAARKAAKLASADVLVPQFTKAGGTDWNDLATAEGLEVARSQLAIERRQRVLKLQHISDFLSPRPMAWMVRGLLPAVGLAQIFGDSQAGKSFFAIDLTLRVAAGIDWHGLRVRSGPVVYIAGEGGAGIGKRAAAWSQTHGVDLTGVPFHLCPVPVPLADPKAATLAREDIVDFCALHGAPVCVVVDTLARNFGEDENSTQAISAFVSALDAIKEVGQCLVLVVHHTGHNSKERSRGSYAWHAALDAEYRLSRDESGLVSVTCTKAKDWEPHEPLFFSMAQVELDGWQDEDGNSVSSLVLSRVYPQESAESLHQSLDAIHGNSSQRRALDVLRELYAKHREHLEADGREPYAARVSLSEWRDELVRLGVIGTDRRRFYNLRERLVEKGLRVEGEYILPVDNYVDNLV